MFDGFVYGASIASEVGADKYLVYSEIESVFVV